MPHQAQFGPVLRLADGILVRETTPSRSWLASAKVLVAAGSRLDVGGELLARSGDLKLDLQAVLARRRVGHPVAHLIRRAIAQKHHPGSRGCYRVADHVP